MKITYLFKFQPGTEQIHIKTAYTTIQQKEKPPKERLYKCGDCDKAFMREEHLKRHTLVHTGHPMHRQVANIFFKHFDYKLKIKILSGYY